MGHFVFIDLFRKRYLKAYCPHTPLKALLNSDAIIFVFTIVALFTIIGTIVSKMFGADATHFISTHWLPNVLFFIIFVLFFNYKN